MIQKKDFEFHCETTVTIDRPTEVVYQALVYLENWTKLLPHVKSVNVLYDDGRYQEFTMTVDAGTIVGDLTVRSVRLCDRLNLEIELFQAEPPFFLKHHTGGWKFTPLTENQCQVVLFHFCNFNHPVAEQIFGNADQPYQEVLSDLLENHVEEVMNNWKHILETEPLVSGESL
ncbi:SRPBCC family protein [Nodularia spumigena CS-586/05]|uniref:type II toxin-antitoxin system RatA family toxin n=1 Tax=Nodularia spumigena TaxID=70799 RepID=UPI00232E2058|nr:SRPBCC family protein [Nodularia spumigena]MDB9371275.1 SRPBCC family protein [Nodularia spumigena CS-586/05]